jgi:hypothetical protein
VVGRGEREGLYRAFIERADDEAQYRDAVKRSRERIEDVDETMEFLEGGAPVKRRRPVRPNASMADTPHATLMSRNPTHC